MMFVKVLVLLLAVSTIECIEVLNPKFVIDIVDAYNRHGIIYHLPPISKSDVHSYHKSISHLRSVFQSCHCQK